MARRRRERMSEGKMAWAIINFHQKNYILPNRQLQLL